VNLENYRGTPPDDPDEWRRIWKTIDEWEAMREAIKDIVLIISAAAVVRRVLPFAIAAAILGAALYNSGDLIEMLEP